MPRLSPWELPLGISCPVFHIQAFIDALRLVGYPDLAKEIAAQWTVHGAHQNPDDRLQDRAVISVHDQVSVSEIVAVIDAIHGAKRRLGSDEVHAFHVTFATR